MWDGCHSRCARANDFGGCCAQAVAAAWRVPARELPIESYACAEQLPSSYTPPAPPPTAPLLPQHAPVGPNAANGDTAGGDRIVADEAANGQTEKVCAASGIIDCHTMSDDACRQACTAGMRRTLWCYGLNAVTLHL